MCRWKEKKQKKKGHALVGCSCSFRDYEWHFAQYDHWWNSEPPQSVALTGGLKWMAPGVIQRESPASAGRLNTRNENMISGQLLRPSPFKVQPGRWRQTRLPQCSRQLDPHNNCCLEHNCNLFFSSHPSPLVCLFCDNNCLLYTQAGAALDFWLEQLYQANKMAPVGCKIRPRLHYFAQTNYNPPEGP